MAIEARARTILIEQRQRVERALPATHETSRHAELLAAVDLFKRLDRLALAKLAANLDPVHLGAGAVACSQGEPGDSLYLVAHGTLGVYVASPAGDTSDTGHANSANSANSASEFQTRVGTLGQGACFGEIALLTGAPRTATVRVLGDAELLRLERSRFLEVLRREPSIGLAISAWLSRRLQESNQDTIAAGQAVRHLLDRQLAGLAPDTRRRVLEASVLDCPSPRALAALFGPDAGAVASGLAEVGVPEDGHPIPAAIAATLRDLLADELGSDGLLAHHRAVAGLLAEAGCWDDALELLSRIGARADFITILRRALSGSPGLADDEARQWAGYLTDDEAAQHPTLALLRAGRHEQRPAPRAPRAPRAAEAAEAAEARRPAGASWWQCAAQRLCARQCSKTVAAVALALLLGVGAVALRGSPPHAFALLLGAAISLWVSAALPEFVVYLGLVVLWIALGITTPEQALAGFGTTSWISAVAILCIAAAIASSGLLFRFGLWLVRRLPAGLFRQGATFLVTGMMMTPLLPSSLSRAGLVVPLALTAAQAQRLRERSRESAFLGLAAFLGANPLLFMFLNGSTSCLLALGLLPETSRARFDFVHWFIAAAPLALVAGFGSMALLWLLLRPAGAERVSSARIDLQTSLLGRFSAKEIAMTAILVATLIGWNVAPALGLGSVVVSLLSVTAAALAGCFDKKALQGLNWDFLLGYGVILAISRLVVSLGISDAIARTIQHVLGGAMLAPPLFILIVAALNLALRVVLPLDQALLLLTLSLAPTAQAMGIDPWIVTITLLVTGSVWYFPTQNYAYIVADEAAEGRLFAPTHARLACLCYVVAALAGLAVSMPYWRLLGLL